MLHLYLAGGLLLALLTATGYAVHELRQADAREIEQLAAVAQHNADTALRVQANAAKAAEVATHAAARAEARHQATQAQLRALERSHASLPAPADTPVECPSQCLLVWGSEDGDEDGVPGVSD